MCLTKTGLKAFLLIMNVLLFLCGAVILGIGIWAVVDKIYLSDVIGNSLFASAAILTVVCGSLLLLISFLGCGGALSQKKVVVIAYTIAVTCIFILLMAAAIVAAVFQDDIENSTKEGMRKTLINNYGFIPEYNDENRKITDAWDLLQHRFNCCAIEDRGWRIYQSSKWFTNQFRQTDQDFVPPSCCIYLGNLQQYQNLDRCQSFEYGPPRYDSLNLAQNPDLHYNGCFEQAKRLVLDQSTMILSIGFSFCVFLLSSIVVSMMYLGKIASRGSANLRR